MSEADCDGKAECGLEKVVLDTLNDLPSALHHYIENAVLNIRLAFLNCKIG